MAARTPFRSVAAYTPAYAAGFSLGIVSEITPRAWLLGQRLHRAEELLETGDLPVEEVARRCGFGTAAALREQFVRRRGVPPREYRRSFAARPAGSRQPA